MVTILYFAWLRDFVGVSEEQLAVPDTVTTIAALADHLAGSSERHARAFADRSRVRAAVDQVVVAADASIVGASEIAFFPPVTGG